MKCKTIPELWFEKLPAQEQKRYRSNFARSNRVITPKMTFKEYVNFVHWKIAKDKFRQMEIALIEIQAHLGIRP